MAGMLKAQGVAAAADRFRKLAANLAKIASGEVLDRVIGRVVEQMSGVARDKLARHNHSGNAASVTRARKDSNAVRITYPAYLHFHKWWPFSKGLPRFIVSRAAKLLREETKAQLSR